ncbi:MAG: GHKL domain-containing protein [Lachnospiraceae bacterium]|nr:GHKL domain-containing protein [Lachnospiraceae bacterium]
MDVIKKYWSSAYIYVLLVTPCMCMCAGLIWTLYKKLGLYPDLEWHYILLFDFTQFIYLSIAIYFIYKIRKNVTYLFRHLGKLKAYVIITLFIQYHFIIYLFPSFFVWECTFIFFALIALLFDSKLMLWNMVAYAIALFVAHCVMPEQFLPLTDTKLPEIMSYRILMVVLTGFCIYLIVYLAEKFLVQAQERNRENIHLLNKQVKYYRDVELLDKELRKFRHDIREHFICMEALMASGQEEKLRSYFEELKQDFSIQEQMYFSGNEIVDAVLNCHLCHDCENDVQIEVYGELPKLHTVSDIDLCTLFSNLLSNAIKEANACKEIKEAELVIRFMAGQQYVSITVINTAREGFDMRQLPSGRMARNHGFGIQKVLEIVEKYNGNIEQTMEDGRVLIQVYLPI